LLIKCDGADLQRLKIVFSGGLYDPLSNPYKLELNSLELELPDTFPEC
jgi:hypothetical protein